MKKKAPKSEAFIERETRFELATPTLARLCSTTELFSHNLNCIRFKDGKITEVCRSSKASDEKKFIWFAVT
jgi:hypothetical protein